MVKINKGIKLSKKLLVLAGALTAVFMLTLGAPVAHAACGSTADKTDDPETTTVNEDTDNQADLPDGGHVYGDDPQDGAGYGGVTGSHGYIELEGSADGAQIDGSSTDAPVQGTAGTSGVCVNDTSAP